VSELSSAMTLDLQRLCARLENGESDGPAFLEACTRLTVVAVGCSRAGVWVFRDTDRGRILRCLGLYDGVSNRMTCVEDEAGIHVQTYFQTLEQLGHVMAADAQTHFATSGFFNDRLHPNGVQSMMAAAFSVNGRLFGAFTCSQVGKRMEWSRAQLDVLRQIGHRASLAIASYEARTALDTRPSRLLA